MQQPLFSEGPDAKASKSCSFAVAVAVLAQLAMMIALLWIENSNNATVASNLGGGTSSGRAYCIVESHAYAYTGGGSSPGSSAMLAKMVNTAIEAGCTLVGGVSVGGEGEGTTSGASNNMYWTQSLMCPKASVSCDTDAGTCNCQF